MVPAEPAVTPARPRGSRRRQSGCDAPCAFVFPSRSASAAARLLARGWASPRSPGRGAVLPGAGRAGRRSLAATHACRPRDPQPSRLSPRWPRPGGRRRGCDLPPGCKRRGRPGTRGACPAAPPGKAGARALRGRAAGRGHISTCSPGRWRRGGFCGRPLRGEGGGPLSAPRRGARRGAGRGGTAGGSYAGPRVAAESRGREETRSRAPRVAGPRAAPRGPRGGASPQSRPVGGGFCAARARAAGRRPSASAPLLPRWEGARERGRREGRGEGAGERGGPRHPPAEPAAPGRTPGGGGRAGPARSGGRR